MKILPCSSGKCQGKSALATPDTYVTVGRMFSPLLKYRCKRCGRMNSITSMQFAQLPRMTQIQIDHATCDVTAKVPTTGGQ